MRKFTFQQADFISCIIEVWYLTWKDNIVEKVERCNEHDNCEEKDPSNRLYVIHNLGRAKEELKLMLTGEETDGLEDEREGENGQ